MRTTRILQFGLWLGLVYGLVEAAEVMTLRLVPGALSWRTGNSALIIVVAPAFYGVLFAILAGLITLASRSLRYPHPDRVLVPLLCFFGAYLAAMLQGQVFNIYASLVLALGVGTVAYRIYRRRETWVQSLATRSLPYLLAALAVVAIALPLHRRWRERSALADLTDIPGATNVLLLVIDTQRADHMSTYGYARLTTPMIDQFAAGGTIFDQATSTSSWTLPSHASLMTGRLPHEHRAGEIGRPFLDSRFPTLAETLARHGYATGGFVANTYWCGRQTGLARGFLHYEDFYGNLGDALLRTVVGRMLAYDILPRFGIHDIPGRKHASDLNRDLLDWIDALGPHPFFAFVNYFDVHAPMNPLPPFRGRFSSGRSDRDPRQNQLDIGALVGEVKLPPPDVLQNMVDNYDESLLGLDHALGELWDALRQRGLLDRTLIIITSDHGESFGDHGFLYHGHSLYRDQTHVPLILRLPGRVAAGIRADWPVGLDQIPQTVLRFIGQDDRRIPGISLFDSTSRIAVPSEVARRSAVPSGWPTSMGSVSAVTTSRWHLIQMDTDAPEELYDLEVDPGELNNLASDPARAETLRELMAAARQARLWGAR